MIKSIKIGWMLMRYTWGLKGGVIAGALLFLGGLLLMVLPMPMGGMFRFGQTGAYLVLVVAVWPAQLLWSLNVSDLVQTSPQKKAFQTVVPTVFTAVTSFACYALTIIIKLLQLRANPALRQDVIATCLVLTVEVLLVMMYLGISFKYYYLGTVLFLLSFLITSPVLQVMSLLGVFDRISLWLAVGSGFAAILVGTGIQYGLSCLVYKKQLHKSAQFAGLKKRM